MRTNRLFPYLLSFVLALGLTACASSSATTGSTSVPDSNTKPVLLDPARSTQQMAELPSALVYKTKKDYSKNVPILMRADRSGILSYPHPKDLFFRGKLACPTPLHKEYWLDNRGIGPNIAFTDYTYEEYAGLEQAPDTATLRKHILDCDPFIELWDCGPRARFEFEPGELNALIDQGFPGCKPIIKDAKLIFETESE